MTLNEINFNCHLESLFEYKDEQAFSQFIPTSVFVKADNQDELIAKLGTFRIENFGYLDGLVHTLTNEEMKEVFIRVGGEVRIDLTELLYIVARLYKDSENKIQFHQFGDLYAESLEINDNVIKVHIGS